MATRRLGHTVHVTSPHGQSVDVKFFTDGAIRFRLNEAGPMMIRYAFLPGAGQNVIVELIPTSGSPWTAHNQG